MRVITLSIPALLSIVAGVAAVVLFLCVWLDDHAEHQLAWALTGFAAIAISATAWVIHAIARLGSRLEHRELEAYEAGKLSAIR